MISIPRILTGLLRDLDPQRASSAALDLAEHSLGRNARVLPEGVAEASTSYLAAARAFRAGGDLAGLRAAHERYFQARSPDLGSLPARVSWVAALAVAACCGRELTEAGVVVGKPHRPSVEEVATEAQQVAGLVALTTGGDRSAAARARWETAREQVLWLVASAPYPGG